MASDTPKTIIIEAVANGWTIQDFDARKTFVADSPESVVAVVAQLLRARLRVEEA